MVRIAIPIALGAVVCAACKGSKPASQPVIANATDLSFCSSPSIEDPVKIGEFLVQILETEIATVLVEDTLVPTFSFNVVGTGGSGGIQHDTDPLVSLVVNGGMDLVFGSNTIEVFVEDLRFTQLEVQFLAEVIGRRIDDGSLDVVGINETFTIVNTCPPPDRPVSQPQALVQQILGRPTESLDPYTTDVAVGVETRNPNSTIDPQVPTSDYTEMFQVGAFVVELDQQQLDAAFTGSNPVFRVNTTGDFGFTIAAQPPGPMMPGEYLIAWQCALGNIPTASNTLTFEYAFYADRDSDPANNTSLSPPNDCDPSNDTDTSYTALQIPFFGWLLQTNPAIASSVRVIFYRQVNMWVFPLSEFDSPASMPVRWFAFEHLGDRGLISDWSADTTPPVGDDLLPVSLEPQDL